MSERGESLQAREDTLLDFFRLASSEVTRNVVDKVCLLLVGKDSLVKVSRLLEVELGNFGEVLNGSSKELLVLGDVVRILLVVESLKRRLVVGSRTLVVESGGTISLEVGGLSERRVDRKLSVVDSETVSVSVGVREESRLEDGIGTRLDSRNEVGRREGDLLNLGAVYEGK